MTDFREHYYVNWFSGSNVEIIDRLNIKLTNQLLDYQYIL